MDLDLTEKHIYQYFLDNEQTMKHQSLIFGLRELNGSESSPFCMNRSLSRQTRTLPITDQPFNFTANYGLRIYTSGCYYINDQGEWKADGLVVSDRPSRSILL